MELHDKLNQFFDRDHFFITVIIKILLSKIKKIPLQAEFLNGKAAL